MSSRRDLKEIVRVNATRRAGNSDVMKDVSQTMSRALTNSTFVLIALVCALVILTHVDDPLNGPFGNVLRKYSDNFYAKWLIANIPKTVGFIVFAPVCLVAPRGSSGLLSLVVASVVVLMPPFTLMTYVALATLMYLYQNARNPATRMIAIVAAGVIGYMSMPKDFFESYNYSGSPGALPRILKTKPHSSFSNDGGGSVQGD